MKVLCSLLLLLALVGAAPPNDVVEWNASRPLQWTDFQGRVPEHSEHAALTYCSTRSNNVFLDRERVSYEVISVVVKSKSWVRAEQKGNAALLDHERLHFDIAECSARSLRRELQLSRVSINECNHRLQLLRDSISSAWSRTQSQYDLETSHGTIAKEQARWAKKIAHTLDSLSAYSEPRFVVALKP